MAKLNMNYSDNGDFYSDGDIENDILEIVKNNVDIKKSEKKYPYPVFYHLSEERENILNWYEFKKDALCLEIGAGCGAITGLLCQKCKKVVSVDISERRSEINFFRHKEYNNLEIIVGNIQKLKFEEKFDYIILNGVFEYALGFIHTENNPYVEFLNIIKGFLNNNGKILIAIENRLGLKYFNGATEDHTENYFLGLNEYDGNSSVRTFSKSELINLVNRAGFKNYKFFYPYPDYKFPNEIYTDETINKFDFGKPYMNFNYRTYSLYSEQKVGKSLSKEGIADKFSNSFLIEIGEGELSDIIYAKLNSLRKNEYKIMTIIKDENGKKSVYKKPMNEKAVQHIQKLYKISNNNQGDERLQNLRLEKINDSVMSELLTINSLNSEIDNCIINQDKEGIINRLKDFFEVVFKDATVKEFFSDEFKKIFGDYELNKKLLCVSPANIDLICDNVFIDKNGNYTIIDCEWIYDFNVPIQFIVWRCLNELYYKSPNIEQVVAKSEMFELFKIDAEMNTAFYNWAVYFSDVYVGENYLNKYSVPVNELNILKEYESIHQKKFFSTACYLDFGNGYSEEDKLFSIIRLTDNGDFKVSFDIPKGVINLRWDIIEGACVKCKISSVTSNGVEVNYKTDNSEISLDGYDLFYNTDPHYTVTGYETELVIVGNIQYINEFDFLDYVDLKKEIINKLNKDIITKDEKINLINNELIAKDEKINTINNELITKDEKINIINNELIAKDEKINAINNELNLKMEQINEFKYELQSKLKQIDDLNEVISNKIFELNAKDSQIEKITIDINRNKSLIALNEKYLLNIEKRIQEYFCLINKLNIGIEEYQMQLNNYKTVAESRGWRFITFLWKIKCGIRYKLTCLKSKLFRSAK